MEVFLLLYLLTILCPTREHVGFVHLPRHPAVKTGFPYGRVLLEDAQKNRFWSGLGIFSRMTGYRYNYTMN